MKTYTYKELPEKFKLREYSVNLDFWKRVWAEKEIEEIEERALLSCDAGLYTSISDDEFFRIKLEKIEL